MKEVTLIYYNDLLQISWSRGKTTCPLELKHVQATLKKVSRSRVGRFNHDERTCRDITRAFTDYPNGVYELSTDQYGTCFWQDREMVMPFSCGCEDVHETP